MTATAIGVALSALWMTLFYRDAPGGALLWSVGETLLGTDDLGTGLSVSAGWVINAAIAEWVIRRRPVTHRKSGRRIPAHVAIQR